MIKVDHRGTCYCRWAENQKERKYKNRRASANANPYQAWRENFMTFDYKESRRNTCPEIHY